MCIRDRGEGCGAQALARGRILRPLARSMRSSPTQAEQTLWARLRHDQLGVRFRAQFVVGRFILDFFCPSRGLAVEVDGGAHVARADIDADRDAWLGASGIRVLRVSNADVLGTSMRSSTESALHWSHRLRPRWRS